MENPHSHLKLVLIDGNAILHRAYHALPSFTTSKGEPVGAVFGIYNLGKAVISQQYNERFKRSSDLDSFYNATSLIPQYRYNRGEIY